MKAFSFFMVAMEAIAVVKARPVSQEHNVGPSLGGKWERIARTKMPSTVSSETTTTVPPLSPAIHYKQRTVRPWARRDSDPTLKPWKAPTPRKGEENRKFKLRTAKSRSRYKIQVKTKEEIAKYFPQDKDVASQAFIQYLREIKDRNNLFSTERRAAIQAGIKLSRQMATTEEKNQKRRQAHTDRQHYRRKIVRALLAKDPQNEELLEEAALLRLDPSNLEAMSGRVDEVSERVKEFLTRTGYIDSSVTIHGGSPSSSPIANTFVEIEDKAVVPRRPRTKRVQQSQDFAHRNQEETGTSQQTSSKVESRIKGESWIHSSVPRRKRTKLLSMKQVTERSIKRVKVGEVSASSVALNSPVDSPLMSTPTSTHSHTVAETNQQRQMGLQNPHEQTIRDTMRQLFGDSDDF